MAAENFTLERLYQMVSYNPETGIFTWLINRRGATKAGSLVGSDKGNGYLDTRIDGKKCLLHRLAWFYVHGEWPKGHIDHINHITTDNRIANLRDVTRSLNLQNQIRPMSRNKSGYLGVSKHGPSYRAQILAGGKRMIIGVYPTPELAHEAYLIAKRKMHSTSML